ncbi:MAG TPA: ABC transporter transmembrane domain-containing protein, partial [Rhizomicrobium sp.]|nr:ABC transporter transmembrane domain-containing protein [Rhizomicrobium sp.]
MLNKPHLLKEAGRLLRPFWLIAVFATAMGSVSGLATAWLLASINRALYVQGDVNAALLWTFAGIVILTLFGEITSQFGNSWIGQQVIASLRKDMVAKIVTAPIDQLERYKVPKLLASLGQDVEVVSSFTLNFSSLAIAFAVTGGCIIYMVFLSRMLFAIVAIAIGISVVINRYARSKGIGGFNKSRAAQDELQKHYRAITEGAKELRLNRDRRHRVQAIQLVGVIDRIRDTRIHAMRIFMSASAFHSALFFAAIGIIVGWQGWFGIDPRVTSGFVLVLLYMKAPLGQVFGAYSAFIN